MKVFLKVNIRFSPEIYLQYFESDPPPYRVRNIKYDILKVILSHTWRDLSLIYLYALRTDILISISSPALYQYFYFHHDHYPFYSFDNHSHLLIKTSIAGMFILLSYVSLVTDDDRIDVYT